MASIRLGDLLVKAKVISETQLKGALAEQQKWGGRLGEILVRMNIVTEDMLVKALSKQLNVPAVNLETIERLPPHVRSKLPMEIARDLVSLPLQLRDDNKTLLVAMAEPQNIKHLDTLRSVSRCKIVPQLAGRQAIARAFTRLYEQATDIAPEPDPSFKLVDSQGHTIIRNMEVAPAKEPSRPSRAASQQAAPPPPPAAPRAATLSEVMVAPQTTPGGKPSDVLRAIEDAQRKEVAALKAMVELLIERGVFTREEYLARVKR